MNEIEQFKNELRAAELILDSQYSFELAEPNYRRCLNIISAHPERRNEFGVALISMFNEKKIGSEPVAYLMHCLRWEEVRARLTDQLSNLANPMVHGRPLDKILEAFQDGWESRDFYQFK